MRAVSQWHRTCNRTQLLSPFNQQFALIYIAIRLSRHAFQWHCGHGGGSAALIPLHDVLCTLVCWHWFTPIIVNMIHLHMHACCVHGCFYLQLVLVKCTTVILWHTNWPAPSLIPELHHIIEISAVYCNLHCIQELVRHPIRCITCTVMHCLCHCL